MIEVTVTVKEPAGGIGRSRLGEVRARAARQMVIRGQAEQSGETPLDDGARMPRHVVFVR
jgi:hypothetical protein